MINKNSKKTVGLFITLIIILISTIIICSQNSYGNVVYESNKKFNKENMLSIMYETSPRSGVYEEQLTSNWPSSGYIFNDEISGCKFGSKLTWDSSNDQVKLKTDVRDVCYVYFDVLTARHLTYVNETQTNCTNVECALDELYDIFG